jgi:ATP-dependent Clp protease protease subunit
MKHTGQPEDVIERDTERDFWMDADAAVEYGLVDEVLQPQSKEDEEEK